MDAVDVFDRLRPDVEPLDRATAQQVWDRVVDADRTASELFAGFPSLETPTAFFPPPGVDVGNINSTIVGTVNPGNIGTGGIVGPPVVSPEQP